MRTRFLFGIIIFTLVLFSGCTTMQKTPPKELVQIQNNTQSNLSNLNLGDLIYKGSFEGGSLYKTKNDKFYVLNLHGSYREMGRQYGYLMGGELRHMYNLTVSDLLYRNITMDMLKQNGNQFYDILPGRFKGILQGMSETSGLTLEEHKILNSGTLDLFMAYLLKELPVNISSTSRCSGVAFWGDYSKDGKLYFGRNWDINLELMQPYLSGMTVAIYHPADGSNAVANRECAGEGCTETAMNEKQRIYGERYPIDEELLAALEHMPPSSGVALGCKMQKLDRVTVCFTGDAATCTGAFHARKFFDFLFKC